MSTVKSIAHYTIEQELGRGGMGVVYRAVDTKLGRAVAVKSLPAEYVSDPLWRTRFEGEARTLAAVNHPNIAAIYGIESDDTGTYLVLELAEGPTLGEFIRSRSPGVEEALALVRQVALGIGEAHAREIVHRDLKPANVKVRPDGLVKVLDFGIAKWGRAVGPVDPLAATVAQRVNPWSSVPGFLLGTPGYMSPEQARGQAVGAPADVWALGCVLYEALAHRMAFGGETLADSIALTLLGEPDYAALPRRTPGRVLRLVQACLRKRGEERGVGMREAAAALEDSLRELSQGRVFVTAGTGAEESEVERGNWPGLEGPLVGRDALVDRVCQVVEVRRLVTLAGAGGSGVTSVAQAAASRGQFRGGAWWVWTPEGAGEETVGALTALSLGVRGRGGGVVGEVIERIGTRALLLVLDGAGAGGAAVAQVLTRACPNLCVLITAPAPLRASGEQVVEVPPLELRDRARLLVGLLDDRAWRERVDEVMELARAIGGRPQVVRQAAALLGTMSAGQFAAQLQQRAAMAGVGGLDGLGSERAALLMAEWALDVQPVSNVAVLGRASVFAGAFSVRAVRAVGGAADALPRAGLSGAHTPAEARIADQLERLARDGLVRRVQAGGDASTAEYMLPGAVKRAAEARLAATPGASEMVKRGYVMWASSLGEVARGGLTEGAAALVEQHYADLVRAAGMAPIPGAFVEAARAVRAFRGLA